MSSGFGEPAKPKTLNELIPLSSSFTKKHQPCFNGKHIGAYGLINMNGRVYDPRLGRFLSPDPYVQAPDYSQSFNRYSYVWNNPLKYTDPSGEIVDLALFLGFAYLTGAIFKGQQPDGSFNWKKANQGGLAFMAPAMLVLERLTSTYTKQHLGQKKYFFLLWVMNIFTQNILH